MCDVFTNGSLRATLGGRPFRLLADTTSTQDIARQWAQDDPSLLEQTETRGCPVVIADHQTVGRGRHGRAWLALPGTSILCSVMLRPQVVPERLPRLTMAGGLAVAEACDPLIDTVRLKWPNDVLIRNRKLSGILTEATWTGDQLGAVIVGIGVNVRTDFRGTELEDYATSLETELGHSVDRHSLLVALLARFDYWVERINDPALVSAWQARLGTLGHRVTVYVNPLAGVTEVFSGTAEAVEDDGALLVRTDSGDLRRVIAADVGLAES